MMKKTVEKKNKLKSASLSKRAIMKEEPVKEPEILVKGI
jgi:hypothetical protein